MYVDFFSKLNIQKVYLPRSLPQFNWNITCYLQNLAAGNIRTQNDAGWPTCSGGTGTRNTGFGYPQYHGEMSSVIKQVEQVFSSFFLPNFWWFLKVESELKVLGNFEKSTNMAKIWQKMKKSIVQLASNPFFSTFRVTENQISVTCSATT